MVEGNIKPIQRILERLPVPVVIANPVTAEILWANSLILKLAGATRPDQIVGASVVDFIRPPSLSRALADLAKVALGQSPPPVTYHLRKLTGEHAAAQIASIPLAYRGQPAMLCVVTDVSDREALLRDLADSEERYRLLLDHFPGGILVIVDDVVEYANIASTRILGFDSIDGVVGTRVSESVSEESRTAMRDARREVIGTGQESPAMPLLFKQPGGSTVSVTVGISRIRWGGEVAVQLTMERRGPRERSGSDATSEGAG